MTQTAHVPAREPVYQILREALRLGLELRLQNAVVPEPHSRTSGFTRASFPSGKSRNSTARRIALDTANTRCAEHAGARHQEPDFTPDARHFRRHLARPRVFCFAPARVGGVRLCTDLGLSPPTPEGHSRMTNRRRTWETGFPGIRGRGRPIQQQGHSAPPRLPTDVQQELREREQRALQSALAAPQRGVPTMTLAQHCRQPWRHPGIDCHRSATPPSCLPRPHCAAPPVRKRLSLELTLLRSPLHSANPPLSPLTRGRITCRRSLAVRIHLRQPRHTPVLQARRVAGWRSTA